MALLERLIKKIEAFNRSQEPFDPTTIDDPLASKTSWTPLKSGGANFRTHHLVKRFVHRVEFRASLGARIFYGIFLSVGIAVLSMIPISLFSGKTSMAEVLILLFPLFFGGIFTAVGGGMWYFGTRPIVFDRHAGYFWKGRTSPRDVIRLDEIEDHAALDDIYAIQLIAEYCRGKDSSFYSYELNLILTNGDRVLVVDHGNKERIQLDAETLSEFLSVPIWSAL